jgi:hypothetical protein
MVIKAEIMACARDPQSRDRDRDRDRDVGQVVRDETLGRSRDRLETETSRPRPHPYFSERSAKSATIL